MRRKHISLTTLFILVALLLAACGGGTTTGGETAATADLPGAAATTDVAPLEDATVTTEEAVTAEATEEVATTEATEEATTEATTEATEEAAGTPEATEEAAATPEATEEAAATTEATSAAGGDTDYSLIGQELADAFAGELTDTTVTMAGPFTGEDETKFNNAIKPFEDATGIDVQYAGSKEFEASISIAVEGGNAPDVVDFPQPGLMANFASSGKVLDANTFINQDWLKQNYNQGWLDIGTVEGPDGPILGGVFHRVNVKSIVWYPKKEFDEAGYQIPQNWEEMRALMDNIVADGDAPWCFGIQSGAATGWPATDWIEDIMLRTTSLENYDKWSRGELPFTDPIVKNAAQMMSDILMDDQYVYGGRQQIVTTAFGDAPTPMFQEPPQCYLVKQGNFITSFFPPEAQIGVDFDFFYLPSIDEQYGKPVLVAGDLMAAFNDRPEVRALMQYFTTFELVEGWAAAGGAISPHENSDLAVYQNDVDRGVAKIVLDADTVRFDASDLMPGEVGAGSFWKGMTNYISGSVNLDQAMEEIQAGWATANQQ